MPPTPPPSPHYRTLHTQLVSSPSLSAVHTSPSFLPSLSLSHFVALIFFLSVAVTPRQSLPLCASRQTIIASSSSPSSSSHLCQLFIDQPTALCSTGLICLNDLQTTAAGSLPLFSDGDPLTQTAKNAPALSNFEAVSLD